MIYNIDYNRTMALWNNKYQQGGKYYVGFGFYIDDEELTSLCWYYKNNFNIRLNEFYQVFSDSPNYYIYLDPEIILPNLNETRYRQLLDHNILPKFKKILISHKIDTISKDFII